MTEHSQNGSVSARPTPDGLIEQQDRRALFEYVRRHGPVAEPARNGGLGSALLRYGSEWASNTGISRVYQWVPASNDRAIQFLQSRGWAVEATRSDHYRIDGEPVDEIILVRELDDA